MKWTWWKIATIVLLLYTVIAGLLIDVPRLPVLNETIRNLFFHVTMWFAMFIIATISFIHSIRFLRNEQMIHDNKANAYASVALFLGVMGLLSGMIWVNYTWNVNPNKIVLWTTEDVKLNAAAMGTMIYAVYFVLRSSIEDKKIKGRYASIFNIFAYVMLLLFTVVIPRMSKESLHPGNAGNPGFNTYDISSNLAFVFYPAILAWTLLAYWIGNLRVRITLLKDKKEQ